MTDDRLSIFRALSVPEVAMLIANDPDFKLPASIPFWRQKMVAAKSLLNEHFTSPKVVFDSFEGDELVTSAEMEAE